MTDTDDCDVFEISEELYTTLQLALKALNQCRNTRLNLDEYPNTYAVCSAIERVLAQYADRY